MDRKLNPRTGQDGSPAVNVSQEFEPAVDATSIANTNVVFACSGCADTGALADSIARSLTEAKIAKMSCLAGIGGRVQSIINNARNAHRVLVIDGCAIHCARRTMEQAGLFNFRHLDLQDLGFRKGASPASPERVNAGVKAAKMLITRY